MSESSASTPAHGDASSGPKGSASHLGFGTGIGLVVANMVGSGVFLSTGFMAQELDAAQILWAWAVGAVIALAGSHAYAALALLVPRSGGEYRFLSDLGHPFLGYFAGWASLFVGFAGPIAVNAVAAGFFAERVWPSLDATMLAVYVILGLGALHAFDHRISKGSQNAMVILKGVLLVGFLGLGFLRGETHLVAWTAFEPQAAFPWGAFTGSLFFIAFAFSGWNATAYAAEEFARPSRDVPRSMLVGCLLVAIAYLLVNWVLVTNVTPEDARVVLRYESERVTLAHVVAAKLVGPEAARLVSFALAIALVSAASAMTLIGPRVYVAMARDGFLPRVLAGKGDRPPLWATLLQTLLALLIFQTEGLQEILRNIGAVLSLLSALTAACLFKVRWFRADLPPPSALSLASAGFYVVSVGVMLYVGLPEASSFWLWTAGFLALAALAYAFLRRRKAS